MNTRDVQTALRSVGFNQAQLGPIDGDYGPRTFDTVKAFQRGFAYWPLLVDGKAGPKTHEALRYSVDHRGHAGEWFAFKEFACRHCGLIHVARELVVGLNKLRQIFGPTPILSGYRCPPHNRAEGGKPNSQHLYGNAADLAVPRASLVDVRGLAVFSGIGWRRADLRVRHVDVRHVGPNTTGHTTSRPAQWAY